MDTLEDGCVKHLLVGTRIRFTVTIRDDGELGGVFATEGETGTIEGFAANEVVVGTLADLLDGEGPPADRAHEGREPVLAALDGLAHLSNDEVRFGYGLDLSFGRDVRFGGT